MTPGGKLELPKKEIVFLKSTVAPKFVGVLKVVIRLKVIDDSGMFCHWSIAAFNSESTSAFDREVLVAGLISISI